MAVRDNASFTANRASFLQTAKQSPVDARYPEPEAAKKWHPAATLAFIIVSCSLLWGGIFAAIALVF
jgi:hypothetical protein